MIGNFGRLQLQMEIGRQFDLQPARQRSFPGDAMPLLPTLAVLAALYERALNLDLGSQEMFPLIPGAVPECMEGGRIEPQLELATHVAADCSVIVKLTFAQWHMEPPTPEIWRKGENAAGKESLTITGRFAGNDKRTESTIRKYGRCFGISQHGVIASAQFRLTNDVECPLQSHSLSVLHARRS